MHFWNRERHSSFLSPVSVLAASLYVVAHVPSNLGLKPQIDMENRLVVDTFQKQKPKDILVLDEFKNPLISVDLDCVPDISHGNFVSKIIEDGFPNANVEKMNISASDLKDNYKKADLKLKKIHKEVKNGKNIDAINISMGADVAFDEFNKFSGMDISSENLASKAREIKDYLLLNKDKKIKLAGIGKSDIAGIVSFIDNIDSLSSKGAKVYVSAGNSGDDAFNLFSLIDNSTSVGALNSCGEKASYSCDNSLVTRWENGDVECKKVDGGISWTDDNNVDIEKKNISNIATIPPLLDIRGTSFASPRALVKDLKKEN